MSSPIFVRPGEALVIPCVSMGRLGLISYLFLRLFGRKGRESFRLSLEFEQEESGVGSFLCGLIAQGEQFQPVEFLSWGRFGSVTWVRLRGVRSSRQTVFLLQKISPVVFSCFASWMQALQASSSRSFTLEAIRLSWGSK